MDGGGDETVNGYHTVTEGVWAGWTEWRTDPFENQSGPFYYRDREDGVVLCAFRAAANHMNGGGFMHGGCVLTFADYCLFAIANKEMAGGHGVTVNLNGDFVGTAHAGDLIEATGEVVKAGRSMVFIRGIITNATLGEPMMSFTGVIKRVARRL